MKMQKWQVIAVDLITFQLVCVVMQSNSAARDRSFDFMENFGLMAKDFDTDKRIERAKIISDEIRLRISGGHVKSALEYGCGTGLVGIQLINDVNSLLFVDSSEAMIEQVKLKLRRLGKPSDYATCHDFMEDVPQNIRVDYIFSVLVLHHIKDTKAILSRLYSILNEKGHFIMVDINADDGSFHAKYPDFDGHHGFGQTTLTSLAIEVGFNKVDIKTFYHGNKTVGDKTNPYSLFILDAVK